MDYPFIADILTRMVGATLIMADIYGVVQPFSSKLSPSFPQNPTIISLTVRLQ